MNGMKTAGITVNGSHDLPLFETPIGIPGAVDTSSGGPSSTAAAGGGTAAICGTGITDCTVGVPCASAAIGRTGRHITMVVECTGAAFAAAGAARLTVRATGWRGLTAAFGLTLGLGFGATTARAAFLAGATVRRRRTAGFALAGVATGEHSTNESTDARRGAACCCVARGTVSRFTVCAPTGVTDERLAMANAASDPTVSKWCFIGWGCQESAQR
jgi:hypothetical protein